MTQPQPRRRPRTPEEICKSKKRYVDEAAAEVMLVKYRLLNKGKKRGKGKNIWENHSYYCSICNGWHLTSQPLKVITQEFLDNQYKR
jgi:hypothetical protein